MKFAKSIYLVSGLYGLLILIPQYFLESRNGISFPPAINHPEYYYGFIGVAVAWQIGFLIISKEPKRYGPLMIAAVIEKYSYGVAVLILYGQGRIAGPILVTGLIDLILGTLFAVAYKKVEGQITRHESSHGAVPDIVLSAEPNPSAIAGSPPGRARKTPLRDC